MNSVLSPEHMLNISLLIAAHFVSVMVHVPSFPFGSPSWTLEIIIDLPFGFPINNIISLRRAAYLPPRHMLCDACDSTPSAAHCVACRAPLVFMPWHHVYSYPKSVSDEVFPLKKAKIKPVIWSRLISTSFYFFSVRGREWWGKNGKKR